MDNRPTNEITDYPLELQELKVMIKRAEQRQWKIRWDLNKRDKSQKTRHYEIDIRCITRIFK